MVASYMDEKPLEELMPGVGMCANILLATPRRPRDDSPQVCVILDLSG